MELTADERAVLERYREKTHLAGGPRAGYLLRRMAIAKGVDDSIDVESGLSGLVELGLLVSSEAEDFVFLTEKGAEAVAAL